MACELPYVENFGDGMREHFIVSGQELILTFNTKQIFLDKS